MRYRSIAWQLAASLALAAPAVPALAQDAPAASVADERWTPEELDNLLAPIALYPDPILAQVLVAATYPDQVLAAQAHVKAFGSDNIDAMPWEISVKAVARYAPVLNLLADGEDWMTALGQAYATQPEDVMDAVQRLRRMANAQGNLQSTAQQQVVVEREVIRIEPAQPQVIYVPTYDPAIVYHQPVYVAHAHPAYWSWGIAYPVGVWLTYDFDWWGHRVYHHGWHAYGPRWVVVARPWIVISPFYVAPRHTVIVVNRGVIHRRWDTRHVRRYSVVHRNTGFDRHDRGFRRDGGRGVADRRDGGRRVGPLDDDQRGGRGRGVGPRQDAYGNRVVPLPGGGASRVARGAAERGNVTRARPTATGGGETTRSSNGTWNPRPASDRAVPAPRGSGISSEPRTSPPSAGVPRGGGDRPRASVPRGNGGTSEPRASAPRGNSGSGIPRASAPRGNSGSGVPRASAPRGGGGSSAPRASAPRGGGSSAPRASAPRGGGGSVRGGGGGGGGSRGSGGGTRGSSRGN